MEARMKNTTAIKIMTVLTFLLFFVPSVKTVEAGWIIAWGNDDGGQVSDTPFYHDFIAVAAGLYHNVALKSDCTMVAWGWDYYGQVSDTPAGNDFIAVAAGYVHNVALKIDGSLVAWGHDLFRQVSDTPTGNHFIAVAAGDYHNVALKSDGSLVAWGLDEWGQVSDTPTGNDFKTVSAGGFHSVALKTDGNLVAWGRDDYGQVSDTPLGGNNFVAVSAGSYHNVAIIFRFTPKEQIQQILEFTEFSIADGTLEGIGLGQSANNKLSALVNMLEAAGYLIISENYDIACDQLCDAYRKCDGYPKPPDFVTGDAADDLADMILIVMDELGC